MKIKFNNGDRALLCDGCKTVIATGHNIPKSCISQVESNELFFCSHECMNNYIEKIKKQSKILKTY